MKIRTDFVTNSSSSSFIAYNIKPGKDREKFLQFKLFLESLCEKYEQHYVYDSYNGRGQIEMPNDNEIVFSVWTAERNRFPSSTAVALAALFSSEGGEYYYLYDLCRKKLFDDEGHLNPALKTALTEKEALRLEELLSDVKVTKKAVKGGTD